MTEKKQKTKKPTIAELEKQIRDLKWQIVKKDDRITELLHANNRYQQDARDSRATADRAARARDKAVQDLETKLDVIREAIGGTSQHPRELYMRAGPAVFPATWPLHHYR